MALPFRIGGKEMIQNKENEMNKGGAFLTTPFGVDEIFTREKWSDDQKEFF